MTHAGRASQLFQLICDLLMRPASMFVLELLWGLLRGLGLAGSPPEFVAGLQAVGGKPATLAVDDAIHPVAVAGRVSAVDDFGGCAATKERQHS